MTRTSDKRSDILKAALELIAEQGFHGSPMAEIAKKADVAAGTIYRYFESKDELINGLHRELEAEILLFLQDGYPAGKPIREKFLHLTGQLLRYLVRHPLHFRYLEQYFNSPYGISLHRDRLMAEPESQNLPMEIFRRGIEQRVLKDLPKAVLFSLAFGPLISLVRDHVSGFVVLDEAMIRRVTEACWDAIKR